jgi:hypothetical protein
MFRIGDIVQVQLSFVVIPIKGGRRKMLTVLRSIALLDGSFSKVRKGKNVWIKKITDHSVTQQIANLNAEITEQAQPKMQTLKRKIGYEEIDDVDEGRNEKRDKMVVDDESGHVD